MSLISNYLTIYSLYNVCSFVPKHWYRSRGYPVKKFVTITKSFISNCLTIYSLHNVCSYLPKHWYRGRGYPVKKFVINNKQVFDFELFDHIFIIQCTQLRS